VRPASSATYRTLEMWRKDCDTIINQNEEGCQVNIGQDGHLKAATDLASPTTSALGGALRYASRMVGLRSAATPGDPALIKQHINQMRQASAALCRQAGIKARAVSPAADASTASLTARELKGQLDRLLDTPGAQLVRVHEQLDEILQLASGKNTDTMEERMRLLPGLIEESYRAFSRGFQGAESESFQQFSTALSLWASKTPETQDSRTEAAFGRLLTLLLDGVATLDPATRDGSAHKRGDAPQGAAGQHQPEMPEYPVLEADNAEKYIPLTTAQLTHDRLCNEPRFTRKDFDYLKTGSFRIYPEAADGALFRHESASPHSAPRLRIHLSLNREDLGAAFPVVRDWIMNPANKIQKARVVTPTAGQDSGAKGQEVTLYLLDDEPQENRDTRHWQDKLAELEAALTAAGIRPGPTPEPDKHRLLAQINGSRFLYYRNENINIADTVDRTIYEERRDARSGLRYFQSRYVSGDIVILQKDLDQVPPAERSHMLPQDDADFLAGVQLRASRSAEHKAQAAPARQRQAPMMEAMKPVAYRPAPPPLPEQPVAYPAQTPPPRPALSDNDKAVLDNQLHVIQEIAPALNMTPERLLNLLCDPVTGNYDLQHRVFPASYLVRYLELQQAKPDFFPDADFHLACRNLDIRLYSLDLGTPAPGSEAFQDWVTDSAHAMEAARAARHAMKKWEPLLEAFMPDKPAFQAYLQAKIPEKNVLAALSEQELTHYRNNLQEELFLQMRLFGPDSMNESGLECIFKECCERLLMRCQKDYARNQSQLQKYMTQDFDWLDPDTRTYFHMPASGFISYFDGTAYDEFCEDQDKSGHKFRISLHPHDYEKAWPLMAQVLHKNDCPFLVWKSTYPWPDEATLRNPRFKNGGQFTLYCMDETQAAQAIPDRFQADNIAQTLNEIETILQENNIRPGRRPITDLPCGQDHPYISYRFDKDKARKKYEPDYYVTHERRREYMDEPYYQNVCRLLNQGAAR